MTSLHEIARTKRRLAHVAANIDRLWKRHANGFPPKTERHVRKLEAERTELQARLERFAREGWT